MGRSRGRLSAISWPQLLKAAVAEDFPDALVAEAHAAHVERQHQPVGDQGGPDGGAQAQKEHPAAVVAAQGLQAGVVHQPHGLAQRGGEMVADPAGAEIRRVFDGAAAADARGQAEGDGFVLPVFDGFQGLLDHGVGRERLARLEFAMLLVARVPELDRGAADVDDEDVHTMFRLGFYGVRDQLFARAARAEALQVVGQDAVDQVDDAAAVVART